MARFQALKIHKQMYPATYNFKDEADGTSGESIAFIDTDGNGASTDVIIIAELDGHKKVLEFSDANAAARWFCFHQYGAEVTYGTIDFWIRTTDATYETGMRFTDGGALGFIIKIDADQFQYYDSTLSYHNVGKVPIDNTWYHLQVEFECTAGGYKGLTQYKYHIIIDGTHYGDYSFATTAPHLSEGWFLGDTGNSNYYSYYDAWGESWDANYNLGDNVHWRHLKEGEDSFEEEDWGTSGTSIDFVDSATLFNGGCEIVPFFNEHKKVLRLQDDATGGEDPIVTHNIVQATSGTHEFWISTNDVGEYWEIYFHENGNDNIVRLRIIGSFLDYFDNGDLWQEVQPVINDTFYHIRVVWRADNTFDVWVDGILKVNNQATNNNQVSGIDRFTMKALGDSTDYLYLDAYSTSSISGNKIADNRTFDYLAYTYDDITSNSERCFVTDRGLNGATATLTTTTTLSELHFIQLYDENSDLRIEGNILRVNTVALRTTYLVTSFNNAELMEENSYTASSAEDVNASLLAIHTNVSQADGRLIYYTEDDPAGNLTPNFRNKPKNMGIRWFAIHGGKTASLQPNGVFTLDDDRNPENGSVTISSSTGEINSSPTKSGITHQINYVEVRGGNDPDRGIPFSGISQDATAQTDGTGIKRYFKRFRELQSDTDCANRASQIRTGTGFEPTIIEVELKSIYALPGEIINFAYSPLSLSAANYFVEASVIFNLVLGIATYRLNTGIFDIVSMNTPGYTFADETADDIGETLFNTDLITVYPQFSPAGGADWASRGVQCNAVPEAVHSHIYMDTKVDTSRDLVLNWIWIRNDANADTLAAILTIIEYVVGSTSTTILENVTGITLNACAAADYELYSYTIAAADLNSGSIYYFEISLNEASRDLTFSNFVGRYYGRRTA